MFLLNKKKHLISLIKPNKAFILFKVNKILFKLTSIRMTTSFSGYFKTKIKITLLYKHELILLNNMYTI